MLCADCLRFCVLMIGSHPGSSEEQEYASLEKTATSGCKVCSTAYSNPRLAPMIESNSQGVKFKKGCWPGGDAARMNISVIYLENGISKTVELGNWHFQCQKLTDTETQSLPLNQLSEQGVVTQFRAQQTTPSESTGHPDVAKLARGWLHGCLDLHDCEGDYDPNWFPTRLIKVGDTEQAARVVLTEQEKPTSRYVALSHCWGPNPSFFMLRSDNIALLQKGIPEADLPKSFRDTMVTCRHMGVQYLWIDSLCIIQSGPAAKEDWLKELGDMDKVYANALFTISIDRAENAHQGAFVSRDPRTLQGCYVYVIEPLEKDKAREVRRLTIWGEQDSLKLLDEQPLSQRAWTFQERILSPRLLRFGPDRIWWECGASCCNEYLYDLDWRLPHSYLARIRPYMDSTRHSYNKSACMFNIPRVGWRSSIPARSISDLNEANKVSQIWMKSIEDYSVRKLTHLEDKLAALGGVASRFGVYFDTDYFAGIFRHELPFGLLWRTYGPSKRQACYQAPTWSWASTNGQISMAVAEVKLMHGNSDFEHCASLEEIRVDLVDPSNKYGPVRYGEIKFNGILLKCTVDVEKEELSTWAPVFEDLNLAASTNGGIRLDERPWPAEGKHLQNFFVLPLVEGTYKRWSYAQTWEYNAGLILEGTEHPGFFRRVGCYRTKARFWKQYIERGEKPQTVVVL